ncbi:MAG TPA: hypothetical protein VLH79_06810 [Chthonomonadales bacterium]|nr:hypothetical protein [Chthonomonadales bacterium]
MTGTLTVTTAAQKLISGGNRSSRGTLIIQNESDTDWQIAIGDPNGVRLTTSNGTTIKASQTFALEGRMAQRDVYFIHGGSGNKSGRYQYA